MQMILSNPAENPLDNDVSVFQFLRELGDQFRQITEKSPSRQEGMDPHHGFLSAVIRDSLDLLTHLIGDLQLGICTIQSSGLLHSLAALDELLDEQDWACRGLCHHDGRADLAGKIKQALWVISGAFRTAAEELLLCAEQLQKVASNEDALKERTDAVSESLAAIASDWECFAGLLCEIDTMAITGCSISVLLEQQKRGLDQLAACLNHPVPTE